MLVKNIKYSELIRKHNLTISVNELIINPEENQYNIVTSMKTINFVLNNKFNTNIYTVINKMIKEKISYLNYSEV